MRIPPELLPVLQVTLPIVLAILGAAWLQNKRLDDLIARVAMIEDRLGKIEDRLGKVEARLAVIETVLTDFGRRIGILEDRIPPLVHR